MQRFCEGFHTFCPNFNRFWPDFKGYWPDFKGFWPDFHQTKSFGSAIAPPPPTPVSFTHLLTPSEREKGIRRYCLPTKDTEAWKKLNSNKRCAVYRERHKTKLIFKKSSVGFARNSLNTSTVKDTGKMLVILNATGNASDFAKCKMCWLKLIK